MSKDAIYQQEFRLLLNEKAPVSQLNDDVLGRIFLFNASLDYDYPHNPSKTTRRTAQVHYRWRRFALSFPSIWAMSLDFADPLPWIWEALSRAGPIPINIVLPSPTAYTISAAFIKSNIRPTIPDFVHNVGSRPVSHSADVLALALSVIHRSQLFAARLRVADWDILLQNIARQSSASIHTFCLSLLGDNRQASQTFTLPPTFLGGQPPHLRKLELHGCSCHFNSPVFRKLTSLIVSDLLGPPTAREWLEIFRGMPELRNIHLANRYYPNDTRHTSQPGTVALPHLESFTMVSKLVPCNTVFSHLQFPTSCSIDLNIYNVFHGAEYQMFIQGLERKLDSAADHLKDRAIVISNSRTAMNYYTFAPFPPRSTPEIPLFSILLHYDTTGPSSTMNIVPPFLSALSVGNSGVAQLQLDLWPFDDLRPDLQQFLHQLNRVQRLLLVKNSTFHLLLPMLSTANADQCLLPLLNELALHQTDFGKQSQNPIEYLQKLLQVRSDIGFGIKTVHFQNSGGIKKNIAKLQKLGVAVEWDAIPTRADSDDEEP